MARGGNPPLLHSAFCCASLTTARTTPTVASLECGKCEKVPHSRQLVGVPPAQNRLSAHSAADSSAPAHRAAPRQLQPRRIAVPAPQAEQRAAERRQHGDNQPPAQPLPQPRPLVTAAAQQNASAAGSLSSMPYQKRWYPDKTAPASFCPAHAKRRPSRTAAVRACSISIGPKSQRQPQRAVLVVIVREKQGENGFNDRFLPTE